MRKIIVFRLSAMGDVCLTVPPIKAILDANQDIEITLVTRKFFAPFFNGIPRLSLYFPDLKGRHKGLIGLFRLFNELKKEGSYEMAIDLHGVIRTRIITFLFKKSGIPGYSIDKGREAKKFLIKSKYIRMLKHTTERYLDTFQRAGLKGQIGKAPFFVVNDEVKAKATDFLNEHKIDRHKLQIGLAPFATMLPKIWGIENFKELISIINARHNVEFFLFGGGPDEISALREFQKCSSNLHLIAGKLDLSEELALIRNLNLMISMDSSNMHLSALSGIPTISIWGGTHPAFGFSAYGQPIDYHIQTPASSLKCRPCSVFGNKPCIYQKPKCMEMVTPQIVYNSLLKFGLLKEPAKYGFSQQKP